MPRSVDLKVTLSEDCVEFLRGKVEHGEYASISDLLTESINLMREQDEEQRRFELEEVIPAYDELMADPSLAVPIEQVRANLGLRLHLKAS